MADIVFDYSPRKQFEDFHTREERFACMLCHRRAGKTVAAVHELALRALYTNKKNARYAYLAPQYRQARDVAWQYLIDVVKDFAVKVRQSLLRVELPNGAWITLYGADNPDQLRGIYLDGVILDEFGDCRPSLWGQVILPCLADRKGFAVFIGTPKGKNHFYKIYERSLQEKNWYSKKLRASESGILDPDELTEMRAQMTDAEWEQEMECSFTAAILGTFYADMVQQLEINGSIGPKAAQYDPNYPVSVVADIGITDSTAMWFWQQTPQGVMIIDYEEHQGQKLAYYFELLNAKPYKYNHIWLPHDAKARTLQTGRSTVEQFRDHDFIIRMVPQLRVQDGINAARKVLPNCYIDNERCYAGVEALRAYRRSYNELTKCYQDKPLHDWASNGSDSFRYLSLVVKDAIIPHAPEPIAALKNNFNTYGFSLDQLHKEREVNTRYTSKRI